VSQVLGAPLRPGAFRAAHQEEAADQADGSSRGRAATKAG
jgi:hypothetical protein